LSLSGIGTIEHTDIEAVTGQNGLTSGRALFTDLPAGAYQLGGELPENVDSPAVFIQSSIEGGIKPVERDGTLDVRPTEVAIVDVYLVLDGQDTAKVESVDEGQAATILGFGAQQVTGGTGETEAAATPSATPGAKSRRIEAEGHAPPRAAVLAHVAEPERPTGKPSNSACRTQSLPTCAPPLPATGRSGPSALRQSAIVQRRRDGTCWSLRAARRRIPVG
jgi:hypothetical protein